MKPLAQVYPQEVPSQVAVALLGAAQGRHPLPHEAVLVLLTQTSPQRWKPATQEKPQEVPSQVAVAFAGGVQRVPQRPHVAKFERFASQPFEGSPSQSAYPVRQVKPQRIPSQVGSAFAVEGQGEHEVPQPIVEVTGMHASPQRCRLLPQTKSQVPLVHVGMEPVGPAGHEAQRLPQVFGSLSRAQRPSHRCEPAGHDIVQRPAVHGELPPMGAAQRVPQPPQFMGSLIVSTQAIAQRVGVMGVQPVVHVRAAPASPETIAQMGVGSVHALPQRPQFNAVERSVSQPFDAALSQSPRSGTHASLMRQAPPAQVTRSAATPGSARQSTAQAPQLNTSTSVSMQASPQRTRGEGHVVASGSPS